jgi:hypothetical protein
MCFVYCVCYVIFVTEFWRAIVMLHKHLPPSFPHIVTQIPTHTPPSNPYISLYSMYDKTRHVQGTVLTYELMSESITLTLPHHLYSSIDLPVAALYEQFQCSGVVAAH